MGEDKGESREVERRGREEEWIGVGEGKAEREEGRSGVRERKARRGGRGE